MEEILRNECNYSIRFVAYEGGTPTVQKLLTPSFGNK
jgi:hypothetical protein